MVIHSLIKIYQKYKHIYCYANSEVFNQLLRYMGTLFKAKNQVNSLKTAYALWVFILDAIFTQMLKWRDG
jgi:hypothetical protein